jgi:hypothetical protein
MVSESHARIYPLTRVECQHLVVKTNASHRTRVASLNRQRATKGPGAMDVNDEDAVDGEVALGARGPQQTMSQTDSRYHGEK